MVVVETSCQNHDSVKSVGKTSRQEMYLHVGPRLWLEWVLVVKLKGFDWTSIVKARSLQCYRLVLSRIKEQPEFVYAPSFLHVGLDV